MDSARPGNPPKLFSIQEAAKKLAVSVDVLLEWDKQNILKPLHTEAGKSAYTEAQLNDILPNRSTLLQQTQIDTHSTSEEAKPGRADAALEEIKNPPVRPSQKGFGRRFLNWVGNGFYEDDFIKEHLKSQVKDSLSMPR